MKDIGGIQELVDALEDAGDKLVIVEFYATWCNACRALFPKICRLVGELPDVLFLKVNFEDNKVTCKSLGVKVLPYFHFYRGAEGRVEAFSCTISKIQRFRDALEAHSSPFCSLVPAPGVPEFPELIAHPELHPEEAKAAAVRAAALRKATAESDHDSDNDDPSLNTPTLIDADGNARRPQVEA